MNIIELTKKFSKQVDKLKFGAPVKYVYNPLDYTWVLHEQFLQRFGQGQKKVLFLGMNPGPFGMAQTGVPFGEVEVVKNWLKIKGQVGKPKKEHPKRPILGLDCPRNEVSGQRLWGYFRDKFKTPEKFFKNNFVINYCPLIFMNETGKNLTPDKLSLSSRKRLYALCDENLVNVVKYYEPQYLVGVGKFAEERAKKVLADIDVKIVSILHPSPASPVANRGWAPQAEKQINKIGFWAQ